MFLILWLLSYGVRNMELPLSLYANVDAPLLTRQVQTRHAEVTNTG